ncbi:MAG: isoprenylcysteine carboxylmethyltransferase family protein [Chthoniobacterales bacterium]|nr:isoprenylcysteine carboxylmethyltransferase family protein [Chthoniobacterales bacterium]
MFLPNIAVLSGLLVGSELTLALAKRSHSGKKDRATLPLLWLVIGLSLCLAFELRARLPQGLMPHPLSCYLVGLCLFTAGLILRWWAIVYLGRFFTVNVAIAEDHQLITTGPYRYVRHPSYSGSLLIFLGFALCFQNFFSLVALLIPISAAFLWRIHVEEMALRANFGERYVRYARETYRVIPFVY